MYSGRSRFNRSRLSAFILSELKTFALNDFLFDPRCNPILVFGLTPHSKKIVLDLSLLLGISGDSPLDERNHHDNKINR